MKKYIVNGQFLSKKHVTGVQRFAKELLYEIDKIIEPGTICLAIERGMKVPQYENIEVIRIGRLKKHLWEQISFPLYAIIYHYTPVNLCNASSVLYPGIICIHDIKVKRHPEQFRMPYVLWYKLQFFLNIPRAKKLLTVSEFSKRELCEVYHIDEKRISVIYNGWNHYERIGADNSILEKLNLRERDYYFSLGSMDPTKNMNWVIREAQYNEAQKFVVTGTYNNRIFRFKNEKLPSNLIFTGFLRDDEVKALMKGCKAFLFPSIYEGFGIPPLEALSAGAPNLIMSDIEVLREIYGDGFIYVDIFGKTYELSSIVPVEIEKKNAVLARYSWVNSARKLLKVLYMID